MFEKGQIIGCMKQSKLLKETAETTELRNVQPIIDSLKDVGEASSLR